MNQPHIYGKQFSPNSFNWIGPTHIVRHVALGKLCDNQRLNAYHVGGLYMYIARGYEQDEVPPHSRPLIYADMLVGSLSLSLSKRA